LRQVHRGRLPRRPTPRPAHRREAGPAPRCARGGAAARQPGGRLRLQPAATPSLAAAGASSGTTCVRASARRPTIVARTRHRHPAMIRGLRAGLLAFFFCFVAVGGLPTRAHPVATTVTLRVWYGTDDPTEGPLAQALATRFRAAHPGVEVSLATYGLEDLNDNLQLAMSA